MSLQALLRTSCTIKRQPVTPTKDSSGAAIDTWPTDIAVDEPCDLQPAGSNVRWQFMQRQLVVTHTIYFGRDVQVRNGDKIEIGARTFLVKPGGYQPPPPGAGYGSWPAMAHVEEQITE